MGRLRVHDSNVYHSPYRHLPATGPAPKKAPDVDLESETATPHGVPKARLRAPRSGAKGGEEES